MLYTFGQADRICFIYFHFESLGRKKKKKKKKVDMRTNEKSRFSLSTCPCKDGFHETFNVYDGRALDGLNLPVQGTSCFIPCLKVNEWIMK